MRIGRDHIASTFYTIVFAYAGAALPVVAAGAQRERGSITPASIRIVLAAFGRRYLASIAATGRHTRSRFSIAVTIMSMMMTNTASTNMPANTPATSNTPSACWMM